MRRAWTWPMLAALFLVLTNLAPPARADETKALEALRRYGFRFERDDSRPDRPVIGLSLAFSEVGNNDLQNLLELPRLVSLVLTDTSISDEGLIYVSTLTRLHPQ